MVSDPIYEVCMATKVKKVVVGPLTAMAEAMPGVAFVGPENETLGSLTLEQLGVAADTIKSLPAIVIRLVTHAISQKVGDSYAGAAEAENPLQYVRDSIAETIGQLVKGEWRVTSAGGGKVSLLVRALARATGQTIEKAQEVVDLYSDLNDEGEPSEKGKAFLKQIRAEAAVKAATAAIKLEDAATAKAKLEKQAAAGGDAVSLAALFQ